MGNTTKKDESIINRNLTPAAQPIAQQLVKRIGTVRMTLSAGVIALSKCTSEEREQNIEEASQELETPPADLHQAVQSAVNIITNSNVKLSRDKEIKIINCIREAIGPQSGITSQDELEAEQIVSAAEADAAKQRRKKV
jgi:hypothetical protein